MTKAMKDHFFLFRDEPTMKAGLEKLYSVKERVEEHRPALDGQRLQRRHDPHRGVRGHGRPGSLRLPWAPSSARSRAGRTSGPTSTRATTPTGSSTRWPTTSRTSAGAASGLQARDPWHLRATGAEVLMPDIKFRLKRQDPQDKDNPEPAGRSTPSTTRARTSPCSRGCSTSRRTSTPSLSFRYCCRASVCGSCAMYINGAYRLACQTNVKHLARDVITVAPMPHLPVVKDMVVDMDDFFAKYEYIMPWLIRNSPDPEKEIIQSPKERKKHRHAGGLHPLRLAATRAARRRGARRTTSARRRCSRPTGSRSTRATRPSRERMPRWDNERGVYRCHTIMNCVEACPKELNPTEGIQWLKKAAVRRKLFRRRSSERATGAPGRARGARPKK